jgi:hypothetical protein
MFINMVICKQFELTSQSLYILINPEPLLNRLYAIVLGVK